VTAEARLAACLVHTLDQRNLRCPQDVAIVTFDDSGLSGALRPRLTAVEQPSYEMGFKATELLIQRIHNPARHQTRMVGETTLHVRESSGAGNPPGLDPAQPNSLSNSDRVRARISAS
jgi:LacI family transcriptional regulator